MHRISVTIYMLLKFYKEGLYDGWYNRKNMSELWGEITD